MPPPVITFVDGTLATAENFNKAFRDWLRFLKGDVPAYTATTISAAAADNSYNDSAAAFPYLVAGDTVAVSGFSTGADNGTRTVVSRTASKLVVSGGVALVNDAGGESVTMTFTQAKTTRAVELQAPLFVHEDAEARITQGYTGDGNGGSYRFFGRNMDATSAIADGDEVWLVAVLRERDGGTFERLGRLIGRRPASGDGQFIIDTYEEADDVAVVHDPPAFLANEANQIWILRDTASGSAAVNVEGDVRAQEFRQAGATIGAWTLNLDVDPPQMRYTGDAEITGQYIAGGQFTGVALKVASTTEAVGANAEKLRNYSYPDTVEAVAAPAGVTCPARFGAGPYSFVYSADTISVDGTDNSFNDSTGTFQPLQAGDTLETSGFTNGRNNGFFIIQSITETKAIVTGGRLYTEGAGASVDLTFTLGYTVVAESEPMPRAGYGLLLMEASVAITNAGHLRGAFYLRGPGSPDGMLGGAYSPNRATGKAVGEIESIVAVERYRWEADEVIRVGLLNDTEADATVTASITPTWLAPGTDIFLTLITAGGGTVYGTTGV